MFKKIIFIVTFLFLNTSFAETCPTILEIKSNIFHHWKPHNIDSGEPITDPELIKAFQNNIAEFDLAEWMPDAPEGPAHCYYLGEATNDLEPMQIYLVKKTGAPAKEDANWKPASLGILHCNTDIPHCQFTA